MNRRPLNFNRWVIGLSLLVGNSAVAQDQGLADLQGAWQAAELVDNGRVIPAAAISGWLPSGGRIEIIDNSMVFASPKDGQRHARTLSTDGTTYPRQLNVIDDLKLSGHGIYRIEDGRLIVCLAPPSDAPRPTDFSAREGSKRVLIVFARETPKKIEPSVVPAQTVSATTTLSLPAPPVSPPLPAGARPLTDAETGRLLPGTWKITDAYGAFFLRLEKNNTYSTYRETVATSAYQQVFTKMPLSSGTWNLKNGQVVLQCTSAVYVDRLYKSFPFTIQSVTPTDMQFVDYAGNAAKATRVQP